MSSVLSTPPSSFESPSAHLSNDPLAHSLQRSTTSPSSAPTTGSIKKSRSLLFWKERKGSRSSGRSRADSSIASQSALQLNIGPETAEHDMRLPDVAELPPVPPVPAIPPQPEVKVSEINLGFVRFYKVKVKGPNGSHTGYTPAPPRSPKTPKSPSKKKKKQEEGPRPSRFVLGTLAA